MRLLVTGKTRSGKSTALHRILSCALRQTWAGVLILDGKGSELHPYADLPGVTFLSADQVDAWADQLHRRAAELPERYAALTARGLRVASDDDPAYLVVADDVQRGTRDRHHGQAIKAALQLIAEQSAALGDVLILTTQRQEHSVPPNVRFNCNGRLRMLGQGYFHYTADGQPTRSGRVAYITPDQALAAIRTPSSPPPKLDPTNLPIILGCQPVTPSRITATLYLGEPGLGKTHALLNHPNGRYPRHIYVDAARPHRQFLTDVIEHAGATAPTSHTITIPDLTEMATLALSAEPTLLLIDNVHQASSKMITSITRLVAAAAEAALAGDRPLTPGERRKLEQLIPYCAVQHIEPLGTAAAIALADANLPPDLPDRSAVARRVADAAAGNPAATVALARRVKSGSLTELRTLDAPRRKISVAWLLIVPILALLIVSRWELGTNSYWLSLALLAISILMRPLFYRSIRHVGR